MLSVQIPHYFDAMYFLLSPLLLLLWPVRSFQRPWTFLSPTDGLPVRWQTLLQFFLDILEGYTLDNVLQLWLDRNVYYEFQVLPKHVLDFAILNWYFFLFTIDSCDTRDDIPFFVDASYLFHQFLTERFSFDTHINTLLSLDQMIKWFSNSIYFLRKWPAVDSHILFNAHPKGPLCDPS